MAIFCQCARFLARRALSGRRTVRSLIRGWMRHTPNSLAFCTIVSMRSPRDSAMARVMARGDSRLTLATL